METKKKLITSLFLGLIGLIVGTISVSFAWFISQDSLKTGDSAKGIQGSVVTAYFDSGTGKASDPFVITRPKHWENMIWLHNNVADFHNTDFAERTNGGYYFAVGRDINGDGNKVVYSYDNNGVLIYNGDKPATSTTLNLACYNSDKKGLIPLGCPQYPWFSELNGNSLTVANFKVLSVDTYNQKHALEDIGIFGYVGDQGACKNIYFNNFVIDTSGAALNETGVSENTHTSHSSDTAFDDESNYPAIGYIAGHTLDSANFSHVYINNCRIDGEATNGVKQLDTYGYFGLVEKASSSTTFGKGNDYKFTFDSKAFRNYFDAHYDEFSDNPIRVRNAEYSNNLIHENEFYTDSNGQSHATTPFSDGVKYVTSGVNTFNLQGDDPDDYDGTTKVYNGYDYSLSTLGYAQVDENSKDYDYTVKAKSSNGTLSDPSKNMVESSVTLTDARATKATQNEARYNYNPTSKKWEYYNIHTTDRGLINVNFNCKITGSWTVSTSKWYKKPTLRSVRTLAYVYIDGQLRTSFTTDACATLSYDGPSSNRTTNIKLTGKLDNWLNNIQLYAGAHKIAFVYFFSIDLPEMTDSSFLGFGYAYSNCTVSGGSSNARATVTQGDFRVEPTDPDGVTKTLTINLSDSSKRYFHANSSPYGGLSYGWNSDSVNLQGGEGDAATADNREIIYHDDCDSEVKTLVGLDENGNQHALDTADWKLQWKDEVKQYQEGTGDYVLDKDGNLQYVTIDNGDGTTSKVPLRTDSGWVVVSPAHWNAHLDVTRTLKKKADGSPEDPIYIGDDKEYIEPSGYNPENIDVVGGGFRFSGNYVTLDGEDDRGLTPVLTGDDIGDPFYTTKFGTNSICLMLSNVGGKNADDLMGTIVFNYSWTLSNISKLFGYDFKSVCFKQGGTSYVYLEDATGGTTTDYNDDGSSGVDRVLNMNLRRGYVQKAAYCALDGDGNILCGFDENGNQTLASRTIQESEIETYVLMVGVKNNLDTSWFASINTRIAKIDFSYVAPKGFGGDFGTVEYRSSAETVTGTIFNFYYLIPAGDKYRIKVSYSGKVYTVTIFYNDPDNNANNPSGADFMFYLYDLTYTVKVTYQKKVTVTNQDETTTTTYQKVTEQVAAKGSDKIKVYSTATSTWTT